MARKGSFFESIVPAIVSGVVVGAIVNGMIGRKASAAGRGGDVSMFASAQASWLASKASRVYSSACKKDSRVSTVTLDAVATSGMFSNARYDARL